MLDPYSGEPIKNLVCTNPAFSESINILKDNSHRLGRDSTIILLTTPPGMFEKIIADIFPDPRTRPGMMRGTSTHRSWLARSDGDEGETNHFSINHMSGELALGPMIKPHDERDSGHRERTRNANYLRSALFAAPLLQTCHTTNF